MRKEDNVECYTMDREHNLSPDVHCFLGTCCHKYKHEQQHGGGNGKRQWQKHVYNVLSRIL